MHKSSFEEGKQLCQYAIITSKDVSTAVCLQAYHQRVALAVSMLRAKHFNTTDRLSLLTLTV